jgi:hypothetical protein
MLVLFVIDLFKITAVSFLAISVYAIWSGRVVELFEYLGLAPVTRVCDFCGNPDNVGQPTCSDSDCQDLVVCDYCDIDGNDYSGWCAEYEDLINE